MKLPHLLASATLLGVCAAALAPVVATAPSTARPAEGRLFVVQAVPGDTVTVSVDGDEVADSAATGDVAGPLDLSVGEHEVVLDGAGGSVSTQVDVKPSSSADLVLHRPASPSADPVVSLYRAPMRPIGPGKARVVLAHTATVPPADVRVDGKVVFTNIANGEYADADVAAGSHEVALLPTGTDADPILGPLDVDLPAGTITMVYAVGSPKNGSMSVVSHQEQLDPDGSVVPSRIETGSSAGLVRDVLVAPFARP